jgi:hypothetical protein
MHARELVELAAIISAHGPVLIRGGERIELDSIEQYWTTSKVRLDRWAWRLRTFCDRPDVAAWRGRDQWPEVRSVLEEILTGEMLTRVWTAVLCAYDRRRGADDAEPVARSVMIGHMEARHRVLTLLVRDPTIDADAAIELNRLRRRAERWTDLLIGRLTPLHDVSEFAFDPQRAKDFAEDLRQRDGRHVWPLLLASMRAAFGPLLGEASPNADLNARIAASIIGCFPADLFDSTGLLRSLWLMRLSSVADDTQGMIEELLGQERPHTSGRRLRRFGGKYE